MGRSTLSRDYDIGRIIDDYERRISALERRIIELSGVPGGTVFALNAATQTIVATGSPSPLPTPVTATLSLPAGPILVQASVSAVIGSGTAFAPSAVASLRYHLSGAISFTPSSLTAALGGDNQPIANGGGTLQFVHEVNLASPASLTIEAMAMVHTGASVVIRGVRVELTVLRRGSA